MIVISPVARAKRVILNVDVPPSLTQKLRELSGETGISQREMVARILDWFFDETDVVQGTILRNIPKSLRVDVGRMALEKLAKGELLPLKIIRDANRVVATSDKNHKTQQDSTP